MINNNERDKAIECISFWLEKGKRHKDGQLGYIEGWFTKDDEQAFDMAIESLIFKKELLSSINKRVEDTILYGSNVKIKPQKNFCSEHMLEYVGTVCPSCSIKRGD